MAQIQGATVSLPGGSPSDWLGFQTLDQWGNVIDSGTFAPITGQGSQPATPSNSAGFNAFDPSTYSLGGVLPTPTPSTGFTPGATTPAPALSGGTSSNSWGHWFARAAVVILGFIFVAVGLSMFRDNTAAVAALLKGE